MEIDVSFSDRRQIDTFSASTPQRMGLGGREQYNDRLRNTSLSYPKKENGEATHRICSSFAKLAFIDNKCNLDEPIDFILLLLLLLLLKVLIDKYNIENYRKVELTYLLD